jgi:enoyl-CoA hydratase
MIERIDRGPVTVLRFHHGKVNALDIELVTALHEHIHTLATAPEYRAVVLTGTGSIFSAGVDLFRVVEGGTKYVDEFVPQFTRTFTMLFGLELPLIAAINGHAIAGGCVLASACDYRVMVDGNATIGVPELRVQVPFPTIALEILRFASAGAHLQELVYLGKTYQPREAHHRGLVDELEAEDALLDRAIEVAAQLRATPRDTFVLTKRQVRRPTTERVERVAAEQDANVMALWRSPETHDAIRRYLEKRLGRRKG